MTPARGYFRSRIARTTRAGVIGCSVSITQSGASASLTALRIAAGAPVAPASPAPLNPPAMPGAGVSMWWVSIGGTSAKVGTGEPGNHARVFVLG
jgi:hypothetical protein